MDRREFIIASVAAITQSRSIRMQRAWDYAVSLLAPSRKELEHGLELHRNSIVFQLYGFAPTAAVDGEALRAEVRNGASEIELHDLIEDMEMTRYLTDATEQAEYVRAWEAAGVTCTFQNAGEEGQAPLRLMKRLAHFTYATDVFSDFVSKVVEADDILAAKSRGGHCLAFTTNGVPLTQRWVSVQDELRYIVIFSQLGVRMMHLTYQRQNMIGVGCGEHTDGGLSDFGRAVVAEMNRLGVIPDVAHSGWRTSLEAAKISKQPVVASHTACMAIHKHFRNKPDDTIRAIVDSGGLIGICWISDFVGGDIRAMLRHVDYMVKTFGIDTVAIGPDVAHTSANAKRELQMVPRRPTRTPFEELWPIPVTEQPQAQLSMAWTNWPLVTVALVQRGYKDSDIQKIIGGNALRLARRMFPKRISHTAA